MPHDEPIFFIDRCLGSRVVPEALRAIGVRVEIHADHFEPNAPDTEILCTVGEKAWIFLSKDQMIRRRTAETNALITANVAAFIATSGSASGETIAKAFTRAHRRMLQICATHTRPIIASVTIAGTVTVLHGQRRGGVRRV